MKQSTQPLFQLDLSQILMMMILVIPQVEMHV